jgi:hypothetical protein
MPGVSPGIFVFCLDTSLKMTCFGVIPRDRSLNAVAEFPGKASLWSQSTAGVTLGAMRVAADVLQTAGHHSTSRLTKVTSLAAAE